jgi:hypothetical protein
LIFPFGELDGDIRTKQFTEAAVFTPLNMRPERLILFIQNQYLFGTKGDTDPAALAPFSIDGHLLLFTHRGAPHEKLSPSKQLLPGRRVYPAKQWPLKIKFSEGHSIFFYDNTVAIQIPDNMAKANRSPACYERAQLAMTANRLCAPESEPGVWDRWLDTVYLPSCDGLKLRHMHEAMDFLYDHAQEVEKAVFFHTANLFNLEVDLIFYDTTTASFTTDHEDDPQCCHLVILSSGRTKRNGYNYTKY